MIASNFTGNLGNHMWIYAITRAVALRNGYEWGFNPVPEYDYYSGCPQMDFMNIDYGIKHNFKYNEVPTWAENVWKEEYEHLVFPNGDSIDYHPFQPSIFEIKDNTKLYIRCCQDATYLSNIKNQVTQWFKIKEKNTESYKLELRNREINIRDDLTIINIRGGEYKGVPALILQQQYWENAIQIMKRRNPEMRFLCITDDAEYANRVLNYEIPVTHFSIGGDYYIINNAKNLILSNSSFAIFPAWLNENNPYVIAPRYWARYNVSTGYWASSNIQSFGWNFLGKDGMLYD